MTYAKTIRRLRPLKARETCPRGHVVEKFVSPLMRSRFADSSPELETIMLRCDHPGCACDVWLTAGAIQRAA